MKTIQQSEQVETKSIIRPKNGHEALELLRQNKEVEIADSHAFLAADALSGHLSFSFKLSENNKGWATFKKS